MELIARKNKKYVNSREKTLLENSSKVFLEWCDRVGIEVVKGLYIPLIKNFDDTFFLKEVYSYAK